MVGQAFLYQTKWLPTTQYSLHAYTFVEKLPAVVEISPPIIPENPEIAAKVEPEIPVSLENTSSPYPEDHRSDEGDRDEGEWSDNEAEYLVCGKGDPWGPSDIMCGVCMRWVHHACDPILLSMTLRQLHKETFQYKCSKCKMVKEEEPD